MNNNNKKNKLNDDLWSSECYHHEPTSPSLELCLSTTITTNTDDTKTGVQICGPENEGLKGQMCEHDEYGVVKNRRGVPKLCSRGHWRPAEDAQLKQLVHQFGPQNWNLIAHKLQGRSGKSCRLRWFNQLDPRINRKPFTEEEEERLKTAHKMYGNKWAIIARLFPGRTDNAVKNHWHVMNARQEREKSYSFTRTRSSSSNHINVAKKDSTHVMMIFNNKTKIGGSESSNSSTMINENSNNNNNNNNNTDKMYVDYDQSGGSNCTELSLSTTTSTAGGYLSGFGYKPVCQQLQQHQLCTSDRQKGIIVDTMWKLATKIDEDYKKSCIAKVPIYGQSDSNSEASGSGDSVVNSGYSSTGNVKLNNNLTFINFLGLEAND